MFCLLSGFDAPPHSLEDSYSSSKVKIVEKKLGYGPNSQHFKCRNPTLAKCGGEAQHLEKVRIWSPPGLPNV
jgi:hypothetical protein